MKILGKEKDYYDSALDYSNADQETWFRDIQIFKVSDKMENKELYSFINRLKEKISFKYINESLLSSSIFENTLGYPSSCHINNGFIAFAGKVIPFIKISDNHKNVDVFYDFETFKKFLEKSKSEQILEKKERERFFLRDDDFRGKTFGEKVKIVFEQNYDVNINDFHIEVNNPIIIFDRELNKELYKDSHFKYDHKSYLPSGTNEGFLLFSGKLSNYQFIKVITPHYFVQELEMFMGNILIKRDPEPNFTDNVKINSHGFDDKISFRKRKENK